METKITQEALQLINSHLSPASRLNLASVNNEFYDVCSKWRDVRTIVFDDGSITLGSPTFVHRFFHYHDSKNDTRTNALKTSLDVSPCLKRLIVQTTLRRKDVEVLNARKMLIPKLYISTQNLLIPELPTFTRLRTLHIVSNSSKPLKIMNMVGPHVISALFSKNLRRVCLTDVYLTENLMTSLAGLRNLLYLDLIGCIVDTNVGAKYVTFLEKCSKLEELSLPSSLYSFTSSKKHTFQFTLRNLKVEKLSVYMDQFDDQTFTSEVSQFLPKNLTTLVVFGNYIPLKRWKLLKDIKKFRIIFGPNESIASCPQTNLLNIRLISHLVRRPPYLIRDIASAVSRSVAPDITLEQLSWKFNLVEWQENERAASVASVAEMLALRQRAFDDLDPLFALPEVQHLPLGAVPPPPAATRTNLTGMELGVRSRSAPALSRFGRRGNMMRARRGRLSGGPLAQSTAMSRPLSESMRTNVPTNSPIRSLTSATTATLPTRTPIIREIFDADTAFIQTPTVTSTATLMTSTPPPPPAIALPAPPAPPAVQTAGAPTDEGMQMIVEALAQVADIVLPAETTTEQGERRTGILIEQAQPTNNGNLATIQQQRSSRRNSRNSTSGGSRRSNRR